MLERRLKWILARITLLAPLLTWIVLVSFGITGSSLGALEGVDTVVSADLKPLAGVPRGIRSDEWGVITPMAISQAAQNPPFPIVNQALGPSGHNMLVVGMTGVPVAHISTLTRPATWGFFFFDLKRALAWYWWTPLAFAFFSMWWLGRLIWPERSLYAIALPLLVLSAPYITAWSYWPAYAIAFPSLSLALAITIARRPFQRSTPALGIPLGLSLAGFFFLLYPPWQVTLGSLFGSMALALAWKAKGHWRISREQTLATIISLIITATLIGLWWRDAESSILALSNTVYPGQRDTLSGGEFNLAVLLRGFAGMYSMYATDFSGTPGNASEFASFHYFWLPLGLLLVLKRQTLRGDPIGLTLLGFIAVSFIYLFVGIPTMLAKWSQWGRVPSIRVDLALGLAHALICLHLMRPSTESIAMTQMHRFLGLIATAIWGVIIVWALKVWPESVRGTLSDFPFWMTLSFALIGGIALSWGNMPTHLFAMTCMGAITIAKFNPVSIAPTRYNSSIPIIERVAVIGPHFASMSLLASGRSVVNGIHYVPQPAIWNSIDPQKHHHNLWNRYQHLSFELDSTLLPSEIRIESRAADQVAVTVHPTGFNWSSVGADALIAPSIYAASLSQNPQLTQILFDTPGWTYWKIKFRSNLDAH